MGAVVATLVVAAVSCAGPPSNTDLVGVPMAYTDFGGAQHQQVAYVGRNVAVLVPTGDGESASTMTAIVGRLDAAWDRYAALTGRQPDHGFTFDGRATIAVVEATCGAGCGLLGSTGIELSTDTWHRMYGGVQSANQYDQAVFYEMGRNFWFLTGRLTAADNGAYGSAVTTGYAVLNRFVSMDAAGVSGAPFNDWLPFPQFRSQIAGLVDSYVANPTNTWSTTLAVEAGVPGSGWGATDLFASFMMRLAQQFGSGFYDRMWIEAAKRPVATNTAGAVDNLVLAASAATGKNLTALFGTTWRFPVSNAAKAEAQTRWGAPWAP